MLHSKKVTSEQLVVFFSRRSASVGLKLRGIADVNFEVAWEQAKLCDKKLKETKDKSELGLLFGIPISIKDNFPRLGLFLE
jgi:Asp-tRNA(Asn)/Glu-tRNA(Gln) amidotransferase A subunit family amidase